MSGFDLSGEQADALLEAAETLNRLHDKAERRISTLEARLARVLRFHLRFLEGEGGSALRFRRVNGEYRNVKPGRVWSRRRSGGRER